MTRAHLARCAAAILRRAATDKERFGMDMPARFGAGDGGLDPCRILAHLARWACAILCRAAAESVPLP
jgi:hypothetical protein